MHAKRGVNLVLSMRIRRILCFIFFFFLVKLVKRDKKEYFGFAGCMVLVAKSKWKKEQTHRLC